MFSLKFYEQDFSEIETQKRNVYFFYKLIAKNIDGAVSLNRKEIIRNKMMILNNDFAKSRVGSQLSNSSIKDEYSSQYFKTREEPQNNSKILDEEEAHRLEEETSH